MVEYDRTPDIPPANPLPLMEFMSRSIDPFINTCQFGYSHKNLFSTPSTPAEALRPTRDRRERHYKTNINNKNVTVAQGLRNT